MKHAIPKTQHKTREGKIKDFTGIDSPFHAPQNPEIELFTDRMGIDECVLKSMEYIMPLITFRSSI